MALAARVVSGGVSQKRCAGAPRMLARPTRQVLVRSNRKQEHDEDVGMHETKIGRGVAESKRDLKDLAWSAATVIRNE